MTYEERLRQAQLAVESGINRMRARVRKLEYIHDKRMPVQDDEDDLLFEVASHLNRAAQEMDEAAERLNRRAY
jgi:hypothetical protein